MAEPEVSDRKSAECEADQPDSGPGLQCTHHNGSVHDITVLIEICGPAVLFAGLQKVGRLSGHQTDEDDRKFYFSDSASYFSR